MTDDTTNGALRPGAPTPPGGGAIPLPGSGGRTSTAGYEPASRATATRAGWSRWGRSPPRGALGERHQAGEDARPAWTGRVDLIQRIWPAASRSGWARVVINSPGVWHTADVHEVGDALFITLDATAPSTRAADRGTTASGWPSTRSRSWAWSRTVWRPPAMDIEERSNSSGLSGTDLPRPRRPGARGCYSSECRRAGRRRRRAPGLGRAGARRRRASPSAPRAPSRAGAPRRGHRRPGRACGPLVAAT